MQRYSKLTMILVRFMDYCPFIKALLKRCYYVVCSVIFSKPYKVNLYFPEVRLKQANSTGFSSTFFGYYDKSPWNKTQKWITFHGIDYPSYRVPNPQIPVSILVAKSDLTEPQEIGKSFAWNWQQGSRLCWLTDNQVVFNDYISKQDSYVAKIINVQTQATSVLPYPINDVYEDKYGLSLNYDRLERLRPDYGYKNRPEVVKSLRPIDDEDGIWWVDMQTGRGELIISLSRLSCFENKVSMNRAWHKVNHIMISPEGDKFIFLHRWFVGNKKYTRLVLSSSNGKDLRVLLDGGMVSHCWWVNNTAVLCWARFRGKDNYYLVDVYGEDIRPLGDFSLLGDGHPSILPDKTILVTDTYPDRYRMRYLVLLSLDTKIAAKIGEFYEPLKYSSQSRCDLHPRWGPDGRKIALDTVYCNERRLTVLSADNWSTCIEPTE
jgi:hypothetical protein